MARSLSLLLLLLLCPLAAACTTWADCTPIDPIPCPNCFAVFVMPDTQSYVHASRQPAGARHLDLVTRYLCQNHTSWTEPATGKQMPILMTIQLGDIVESGDSPSPPLDPMTEWRLADAAFDNLDACTPAVPYLVTVGNHDIGSNGEGRSGLGNYQGSTNGYEHYFGVDRWTKQGHGCATPASCDLASGKWFIGGGDPIAANARNNVAPGIPGPATVQAGRHRAGLIRAPNGQRFLFLGLELAIDYPPAAAGFGAVEGDDSAWPRQVLSLYPDVATIVFHHSMLWMFDPPDTRLRWGPEIWQSDSISQPPHPDRGPELGTVGGMKDLYERIVEPFAQVRFLFTGHVFRPTNQADYTIARDGAPPVWAFLRNYQNRARGAPDPAQFYGAGWNVIAVFDPDAGEVRVRSYRIDDVAAYADPPLNFDHAGAPAPTECLDTDESGWGERVISWDFKVNENTAPSPPPDQ